MTTVILAEKPSQARSYIEAFKNSTKKQGYYAVSDPVLPNETFITYGFGHLVELATPEQYDTKYKQWALSNLPIFPEKYKFTVPTDKKAQVANQKNTEQQEEIDAQIGTCPICNTGKIVDKGKLYGCTNYKADELCTFSLPKKWSEKNLGKTAIKDLITKGQTTKLKGFKSKKLVRSLTPN